MKNIISLKTVNKFCKQHASGAEQIKVFFKTLEKCNFNNSKEVTEKYSRASCLTDNRVVFRIKGNNYRVIIKFNYAKSIAFVRFLGTHAEYDKINANTI